jgi:hypothetical protein
MATESSAEIEDIREVQQDDGTPVAIANDGTYAAPFDAEPIDTTGVLVELDTRGKRVLDLAVEGTDTASYALEASANGSDWFGPYDSFGTTNKIVQTYRLGARYVRVVVTESAGADATASGFLEVS